MPHCSKVVVSRPARTKALAVSLLFGLLSVLLLGCGITLSEGQTQTELFKKLTLDGAFVPGGELRLGLEYAQPYSTSLDVQCDLLTLAKPTATPKPTVDPQGRKRTTPTPVHIPAEVPTPGNRLSIVLTTSVGPNPNGSTADEATPVLGGITRKFNSPDEPGRYRLRCYTPADENNQISRSFSVQAAQGTPAN